jgi:hypothetical protein
MPDQQTKLQAFRAQYPQYDGIDDQKLADGLYNKFYSTMDRRQFDADIGLKPYEDNLASAVGKAVTNTPERLSMGVSGIQQAAAEGETDALLNAFPEGKTLTPQEVQVGPYARELVTWGMQKVDPDQSYMHAPNPGQAYQDRLTQIAALINTPEGREDFLRPRATEAAKRSLTAQLNFQQAQKAQAPIDVAPGSLEHYLSGAVGSVAEMAPGLALSILTRNPGPAMLSIGAQVGGTNYAEARQPKQDGQFMSQLDPERARQYATLYAAAEAIPEALPLGIVLKEGAGNLLVKAGKTAVAEAVQEAFTEALQIGIDMGYLNPNMTWGEARTRLQDAAVMGAIAGPLMATVAEPGARVREVAGDAWNKGAEAVRNLFPNVQQVGPDKTAEPTMTERVNAELKRKGFAPIQPEAGLTTQPAAEPGKPVSGTTPAGKIEQEAPAPSPQPSGTASDRIIQIESAGNPTAQNPDSSAGGLGQFIDSTWLATVRKHAPELNDLTDEEVLTLKTNGTPEGVAFQKRMIDAFTGDNAQGLTSAGIEATDGNLYAAHFLGLSGAIEALKAPDATPLAQVVDDGVIEANPFLKGMTVGDFRTWTDGVMSGAQPGGIHLAAGGSNVNTSTQANPAASQAQAETAAPTLESEDGTTAPPAAESVTMEMPAVPGEAVSTAAAPVTVETSRDLERVAADVNPEPTEAQKEAGNYRMGHVSLHGLNISIENPRGSIRRGTDPNGGAWEVTMPADYGYIKRTRGADGDHVDVYIGDEPMSDKVYVVDQIDSRTGKFDEHKVILGATTPTHARGIYDAAFSDGKGAERRANITELSMDQFKEWLDKGDISKPFARLPASKPAKQQGEKKPRRRARYIDEPVNDTASVRFDDEYQARQFRLGAELMKLNGITDVADAISGNFRDPKLDGQEGEARELFRRMRNFLTVDTAGDARTVGHFARHAIQVAAQIMDEGAGRKGVFRTISIIDPENMEAWVRSVRDEEEADSDEEPGGITITAPGGMKIDVRPEVVSLDKLKAASGDLQPRDRSRAASDAQIEDMAINLDADRLLPSKEADRGAPIVGPDNVVESGNGRVSAIRRARQAYPERYAAYLDGMKAAGYDLRDGDILVLRRTTDLSPAERVEFVNAANTSAIARMSATEQAVADSRLIDDSVLASIEPGSSVTAFSLGANGNELAQAFLAKLPQAERAALTDAAGQLNTDGVRRIQNALMAAAYGDAATVAKAAEAIDDSTRAITGALIDVSAAWIAMRRDIEAADVSSDYDMTDALMGALKLLDRARTQAAQQSRPVKALINEALNQSDMLSGDVDPLIAEFVTAFYSEGFARAKGRDKIAALLRSITVEVGSAIQPQLLGETPRPEEIIGGAKRRSEKADEGELFAARAPRGRAAERGAGNRERSVQNAGIQDQQRTGTPADDRRAAGSVGTVSRRAAEDAEERAEPGTSDRRSPPAGRGKAGNADSDAVDALSVDRPMPRHVPAHSDRGMPSRPPTGKATIGNRTVDLPPLDEPVRREGVRTRVEDIIGRRLYYGKIKGQSRLGFYRRSNSELRIRKYDDIEVMAHELAHYLDFHYAHKARFSSAALPANLQKEVSQLSYTSDPQHVVKEGFAEYVRLWLTQYDQAAAAAPKFTGHFEAMLAQDAKLARKMTALQEEAHKWFQQGAHAQLRAKSGENYKPAEQIIRFMQSYPAERFRQEAIDGLHAAKVIERALHGELNDATRSAYKQFQLVNGAESMHEAVVKDGTVTLAADGSYQFNGDSLTKVFWPVAKHGWKRFDLLMDYFKARRAAELMRQGRENLFTPDEIEAGLALGTQYPDFAKVFDAYQAFNGRMLDFYQQMDLLTAEQRATFAEANKSYVPFQRITKRIADGKPAEGGQSALRHRLKGGSANIGDVAENIVEGLFSNIRAAAIARAKTTLYSDIMRNQDGALFAAAIEPDSKLVKAHIADMAKTVAGVFLDLGIGVSKNGMIVNQPNVAGVVYDMQDIAESLQANPDLLEFWMLNQPPKTDGDTFVDSAVIDGKRVYFEVREPLLVEMLTGMRGLSSGAILRALYGVKNLQTRTVTSMLQFLGPNAWRDTISAAVLSKNKFWPVYDTLVGMGHAVMRTPTFKEFRLQGGGYGTRIEARTEETRARKTLDLPARNNWDRAAKILAAYDRFASAFEYGSRLGDYRRGRIAGKTAMQAAWEAREITTDFSKIGRNEFWAKFIRTVPFMNAGIQSIDKTARELTEIDGKMTVKNLARLDTLKAKFVLKGSVITAMTIILWSLNHDDDRYKQLTDDERARFWHIWLPNGAHVQIPRPYDIGHIFASIPETMLNYASDHDGDSAASQLAFIAQQSFPMGDYPGIVQPWIEVQTNKTFTGAPIVPNYMADRPPMYQFNDRTPGMYIALGKALNVSPLIAQHYAQGYLRYVEQYVADATEALFWNKEKWGERPFAQGGPIDYLTHQFVGREVPYRTKWTEGYYELKRRAAGMRSAFSAMEGLSVRDQGPLKEMAADRLSMQLVALDKVFNRIDAAFEDQDLFLSSVKYNPRLSAAEKEEQINAYYAQKNAALGTAYKQIKTALDEVERSTHQ